ncbi:MAG: hypothetical protein A3F42_06715 [Gammaproteobacteria bacterium RIFCSPHIGHO2_12_FULL_37_34]|nr:MAG: hypothetical protein A3F42_06715 [Gammaproteobacteria bacterium RIFCSPHIGHO2_12_FULL_37_34]
MFLSIFLATCRPHNIIKFLDNLVETASDPRSFEVLIKIDEGDQTLTEVLENYKKSTSLTIKYLATPKLDGYYSLQVGYNKLLKITHPDSYFCWLLTDEIRLRTTGWDAILKNYIRFYPDDIFRLKLSIFQLKNYLDLYECLPCPDNYAVTTRKWLELTGGWGEFWGPDSWHQCVDFYLALCKNKFHEFGIWRSIPVFGIEVAGQEAGQGSQSRKSRDLRVIRIRKGWKQHSTHSAQENFYRLAQHLNAHIYAHECKIAHYIIRDNPKTKMLSLIDQDEKTYQEIWSYHLPKFRIQLVTGYKIWRFRRFLGYFYVKLRRGTNLTLLAPSRFFRICRIHYESFFNIEEHSNSHRLLRKCERKLLLPNLYVRLIERRARKALARYRLNKKMYKTREGATDYQFNSEP